jgi:hypothetical protein
MPPDLYALRGDVVDPRNLAIPRANDLAARLLARQVPYTRLLECRRLEGKEVVVARLEVEVPQRPVHDIRGAETIAIVFNAQDDQIPLALALRKDFPTVPHLNITDAGYPRSLCLFEETFDEIRARLSSPMLVERLRDWLRLTARGELHAADQPLEPLLVGAVGRIVLPHVVLDVRKAGAAPTALSVTRREDWHGQLVLIAENATSRMVADQGPPTAAEVFYAAPRTHGILSTRPRSIRELDAFLHAGGDELLGHLRAVIPQWHEVPRALSAHLLLVVVAPKTRNMGGAVEAHDLWAFFTSKTVGEIGLDIGVFDRHEGIFGRLLRTDGSAQGDNVLLDLLNVSITLSREEAAQLSGRERQDDRRIVGIGVGALGSQVVVNAARIGYGRWTLVDGDIVLPHNVARHALPAAAVGLSKASAVAMLANDTVDTGDAVFTAITADVLRPADNTESLDRALANAELIVDMSASVAVARRLARRVTSAARRVSMFLNPSGTDLVLLAEDAARRTPLDALEMQYYRAILRTESLRHHLQPPSQRVRYGRSCRDVSVQISQESVALHAAIGTRALRSAAGADTAVIRVWQTNTKTGEVSPMQIAAEIPLIYQLNGWTVILDEGLTRRLAEMRSEKLPRETGGVLLGTFDLETRIVYVVDTIATPPDSDEQPTWFIRGSRGLPDDVATASERTGDQVEYIGEWHSHPKGHSCHPSIDDAKLFAWLTNHLDVVGLPAVMLIVGDDVHPAVFVGEIVAGEMRNENRTAAVAGLVGNGPCSN